MRKLTSYKNMSTSTLTYKFWRSAQFNSKKLENKMVTKRFDKFQFSTTTTFRFFNFHSWNQCKLRTYKCLE